MSEHDLKHELGPWAMVPRSIIQHTQLSSGAVRVYACLADMAGRDRPAWPSHKTLSVKCNMSVSSVRRHIRELVDVGALHVKQRYKQDNSGQTSNLYKVMHNVNKPVGKNVEGTTKNTPITTGEHGPLPQENTRTRTTEQEPSKTAKKHIEEARRMLKNDTF